MTTDAELLASIPEHFCLGGMFKARAATEGAARVIYVEASQESPDLQGEIVLAKALREAAPHFLKFGVLDIDHKSMPPIAAKLGIDDPEMWQIGRPLDVRWESNTTIVKAQLFQGDTPLAARAGTVWDGLTKLNPPARYYASVGGGVKGRDVKIAPDGTRIPVITAVHWNNLALSLEPVNHHMNVATTTPFGVFAKSMGGFVLAKDLTATNGVTAPSDPALLTGGAALRRQSLWGVPMNYLDFREQFAGDIRKGLGSEQYLNHAITAYGITADEAAEHIERFLRDIRARRKT
ncbi:MAG: hypothetical protein LLG01_15505 [Planctomycetaceae bacterium]|nr:hypothetical protein [Planctomycetaceae bacterium]